MKLYDYLLQKHDVLIKNWYDAIMDTYSPDSAKVLSRQQDRFQNPVGYNLQEGVRALFNELLGNLDKQVCEKALDAIIRIRSVQDFAPSEAVGCIFLLKDIIRRELKVELSEVNLHDELTAFEDKIDRLVLQAFDNYAQCREQLYALRIREAKAGSIKLIDRLNRRAAVSDSDDNSEE